MFFVFMRFYSLIFVIDNGSIDKTKEIPGWKACEVRHAFNISDIRRGYIADLEGDKITDKKEMNKIIEPFGVPGYES